MIDEETKKDGKSLETITGELRQRLAGVQEKLNRLTRGYLDELIDRESYQAVKADPALEKITLKREKERLSKTHSSY